MLFLKIVRFFDTFVRERDIHLSVFILEDIHILQFELVTVFVKNTCYELECYTISLNRN